MSGGSDNNMNAEERELRRALALSQDAQQNEDAELNQAIRLSQEAADAEAAELDRVLKLSVQEQRSAPSSRRASDAKSGAGISGDPDDIATQEALDLDLALKLSMEEFKAVGGTPSASRRSSSAGLPHPQSDRKTPSELSTVFGSRARCSLCGSFWTIYDCRKVGDKTYCASCFKCTGCREDLTGGKFMLHDGDPYCEACGFTRFCKVCSLCSKALVFDSYMRHSYFEDEVYCVEHQGSHPACFCCGRLEPLPKIGKELFVLLPDGRRNCVECSMSLVVDSGEMQALYKEVVDFMQRELSLVVPPGMREVPVLAVDLPSLNQQRSSGLHGDAGAVVRGLTLSTCAEVSYVAPGAMGFGTSVFRVREEREVTAVLVLCGMPRDLTASILAHEAMHVYLRLSKHFPAVMEPFCEEGLCQVVASRYLNSPQLESRRQRGALPGLGDAEAQRRDRRLRAYFSLAIEVDPSFVYGDGYRAASQCVECLGMEITLEEVANTGSLPPTF